MKFVKQSFMGIELDILVGYPEHDILFIATQVAEASGLQSPRQSVSKTRQQHGSGAYLSEVIGLLSVDKPKDSVGRNIKSNTVMFTESETYQMLLRGHAPQSEPFRKYNAEESTNPISAVLNLVLRLSYLVPALLAPGLYAWLSGWPMSRFSLSGFLGIIFTHTGRWHEPALIVGATLALFAVLAVLWTLAVRIVANALLRLLSQHHKNPHS